MGEFVAVFFGVAVGLLVGARPGRLRLGAAAVLCVALGAAAAWINEELADEPWLIVFDAAQVLAACALTVVALRVAARRRDVQG